MTEYIVKNRETGGICSEVATKRACDAMARMLNTQFQTDAYFVQEWRPTSEEESNV